MGTVARGDGAHAEGGSTFAKGEDSHAEGTSTQALGRRSHAGGWYTIARCDDQTVIGVYNRNKVNTLFEVGNGSSNNNRSNAFEVYKDGSIAVGGVTATPEQLKKLVSYKPAEQVYLSQSEIQLCVGETVTLTATVLPASATDKSVVWSSSNPSIVSVDDNGNIVAKSVGTAVISATAQNGKHASSTVVVEEYKTTVSTEQTVVGNVTVDIGVLPQSYRVLLNLTYCISEIQGNKAKIEYISVFSKFDKNGTIDGVSYPDLGIGITKLNENEINMVTDTRAMILSPDWVWCAEIAEVNQWVELGSIVSTLVTVMFDSSIQPYHDVRLETSITV